MSWFNTALWALQLISIAGFWYSSSKSMNAARAISRDLHEAHALLVRAMRVLRDHEDFDSRYTYDLLNDYMNKKLASYGIPEVPPLPRREA